MLSVQEYLTAQKEAIALSTERGISYDEALREVARNKEKENKQIQKEHAALLGMMDNAYRNVNKLG
jgi:hypothetical protein